MSWTEYVSGGVGPPALMVNAGGGTGGRSLTLPDTADIAERFEAVTIRRTALNGALLEIPRGFRYHVAVRMGWLDLAAWRDLAAAFAAWRAGAQLSFIPHVDYPKLAYVVAPAADFGFGYVGGKYLGYAGVLELTGTELLPAIPMSWTWDYFCASGETAYAPEEVSHFVAAGLNYGPGEASQFSPSMAKG